MDDNNLKQDDTTNQITPEQVEASEPETPVAEEQAVEEVSTAPAEAAKTESEPTSTEIEASEVKSENQETEVEDVVASADQSVSEQGEDEQSAEDLTSTTSDEPVRQEADASLTGEHDNVETKESTEEPAEKPSNDNPNAKWYVVHTYSGHENRVATTLRQRIESEHLEEKILDILVPTQDKIEIKSGKKVNIKEKIFPGYILVKMVLDDASWLAVRTTQGVTSFVGIGNKPTPISESEVQTIVRFTKEEAPTYKQVFQVNDTVKIVDGPFAEFIGKIDHVDEERGKVKVLVSIFGRETPVELDFLQVQKI